MAKNLFVLLCLLFRLVQVGRLRTPALGSSHTHITSSLVLVAELFNQRFFDMLSSKAAE